MPGNAECSAQRFELPRFVCPGSRVIDLLSASFQALLKIFRIFSYVMNHAAKICICAAGFHRKTFCEFRNIFQMV